MKLSFGQSARELGLLYAHVRTLAQAGKIPYETVGNYKYIDRDDLHAVRQAAVDAGYIQQNPKLPDPKHFPAWLLAIGFNDASAISTKANANLYQMFMGGYEPPFDNSDLPGPCDADTRIRIDTDIQIEGANAARVEGRAEALRLLSNGTEAQS